MKSLTIVLLTALFLGGCSSLSTLNAVVPDGNSTLVANIQYGALAKQQLDIHQPAHLKTNAPVILFFYGGRWQTGSKEEYQFVGQSLAKRGFITVIADYRVFPNVEFPNFINDGALATQWVLNNIVRYGGDHSNVYLMGHSAGAHMAAMLIANKKFLAEQQVNITDIRGFIGLSGPYDFKITDDDIKQVFRQASSYKDTQPITFIDGSEPPMLLLHGQKDKTLSVTNSQHMAEKTNKMGGNASVILYKDMAHVGTLLALADAPFLYFAPVLDDIEHFIHCTSSPARATQPCISQQP
ncbi:MAG: alpha/beta hydrolase [Cycloclasticus sp.]